MSAETKDLTVRTLIAAAIAAALVAVAIYG